MPYGYEKYRLDNGISPNTVTIEIHLINSLLAYIDAVYEKSVEPHEIKPIDIRDFLLEQKEEGLKDATILRKLGTIRSWFDYMWQINKIPNDFMPKFKLPEKLEVNKEEIHVDYSYLLSKKAKILNSPHIRLYGKMLYILYMRGFRVRDIVKITLDQIEDHEEMMTITLVKSNGYIQKATFTDIEIRIFLECIEKAVFRGTPYLLSSKVNDEYVPLQLGSFKGYILSLKEELNMPFRSEQIRLAYAHYLHIHEHKTIEELVEILGMSETSISMTLKEAIERVKIVDYNE